MDRELPSVNAMRKKAKKRIPHFAWEYLNGGIGRDLGKAHNRQSLDDVRLLPNYLQHSGAEIDTTTKVLGQEFAAPFAVAPIGLGGLMWPKVAEYLAKAAREQNIPFTMSTFATATAENIYQQSGRNSWFQLYKPNDPEVREHLISRAEKAGFETMLLTVDIPVMTRREREFAVGLALPPTMDLTNIIQMLMRPRWLMATLSHEIPKFHLLDQYVPNNLGRQGAAYYVSELIRGHQSVDQLKELRERWKGKLLIKGLQSVADVARAKELGYDGVVISNHGGRQLESAPSAANVLPALRQEFPDYTLLADGGVRHGADITKLLALGANMVLVGRAMMYGVCAAGEPGAAHVINVLKQELVGTMGQLGITTPTELAQCLYARNTG